MRMKSKPDISLAHQKGHSEVRGCPNIFKTIQSWSLPRWKHPWFLGNQFPGTPNDVDEWFWYDQSYDIINSDMHGWLFRHWSRKVQTGLSSPLWHDMGYGAIRSNSRRSYLTKGKSMEQLDTTLRWTPKNTSEIKPLWFNICHLPFSSTQHVSSLSHVPLLDLPSSASKWPWKGLWKQASQVPSQNSSPIMAHQRIAWVSQHFQQCQHVISNALLGPELDNFW